MPQRKGTSRVLLLVAFLCCAAALGLLMFKKYHDRVRIPTPPAAPHSEIFPSRVMVLFFAAPDGSGLARESREIDACANEVDCIRAIITELVKGPLGELEPTLPQTVVNGISVANGIATIDLGEGFITGLPGGSSSEMTAAYSIVNSIAVNIPGITGVKFLIDGRVTTTLKGNLDVRNPLSPDYSLEKIPAGSATGEVPPAKGLKK
jgi:spore germination protein GerM